MISIILMIAAYFFPTVIASFRDLSVGLGRFFLLNLCVGWTGIGWVFCAIWAIFGPSKDQPGFGGAPF